MTIRIGDRSPGFRAPTSHGQTLDDEAFRDKLAVVLFFASDPADPMTQIELDGWDEHLVDFGHLRVQVLGVVAVTPKELREFAEERNLAVTLLADPDRSLETTFAVDGDPGATVVVDRQGTVASTMTRRDPVRHAAEVLRHVAGLRLVADTMGPSTET